MTALDDAGPLLETKLYSLESDGSTIIRGPVPDRAALHGLLRKVRDLGLPLVSVNRVEPDVPASKGVPA